MNNHHSALPHQPARLLPFHDVQPGRQPGALPDSPPVRRKGFDQPAGHAVDRDRSPFHAANRPVEIDADIAPALKGIGADQNGNTAANERWYVYNDVWYSSDGINWSVATDSAGFSPRWEHTSVTFNNKIWVIAGYSTKRENDVWYTNDGITWVAISTADFQERWQHASSVLDSKLWIIGGKGIGQDLSDVWFLSLFTIRW